MQPVNTTSASVARSLLISIRIVQCNLTPSSVTMEVMARVWSGTPPTDCNTCGDIIMDEFVDGKTKTGPWAIMCPTCHKTHGVGLGTGKGQRYKQQGEDYVKVEG